MNQWKNFFKNNYSSIVDIFYGQFVSKIMSIEDNTDSSNSYEPFCYLTLPIPNKNNVNIYDCLKFFCKTENLKGDCQWTSDKYKKKVDAVKQMMFWSTPKILIVAFKDMVVITKELSNEFLIKELKKNGGYDKHFKNMIV